MSRITFFTRPDCPLCDSAFFVVSKVCAAYRVPVEKVDISANGNEAWLAEYKHDIPVVHFDGREVFRHRVQEKALRALLKARHTDGADSSEGPPRE